MDMKEIREIMEKAETGTTEETLDPADWETLRALAHRMIDDAVDYLRDVGERPVWQKTPESTRALARAPLPEEGAPLDAIYADFKTHIMPYTKGNIHPRFFSWVQGTGTMSGALADMLASVMNPNAAIGDHAAMYIDQQVIDWCKQMFGFPEDAGGILLSGGSVANITGIAVARNAFSEAIRPRGIYGVSGRMTLYCSVETHSCLQKAAETLGLGAESLRNVPVGPDFRIRVDVLREMIRADRAAGLVPFCIVGNAGTVNTGAIDPLDELLAVARAENCWFHIDGAFGALAKLLPEYAPALAALEQADSVAFDLHKWMYMPYEVGCVLIRDAQKHRAAFALQPNYLLSHERGLPAGPDPITNYGMELSRGFKALKVWVSLREHGIEKYSRLIRQNIAQAFYLGNLVEAHPRLELSAPVTLNIACFRYNPGTGMSDQELDALNKEILMQLHEQGVAAPSYTLINGRYAIRACIVNHRTKRADLEAMTEGVVRIGDRLIG
jgi:aromatic-L-amino-acid/L-tryptophan decarboxylase